MPRLQDTLARLGSEHLAQLIGRSTIQLLERLGDHNLTPTRLAELVVRQIGPEQLLLTRESRNDIFRALPFDEARHLCALLGIGAEGDPYEILTRLGFRRGDTRTNVLLIFFGQRPLDEGLRVNHESACSVSPQYPLFEYQRRAYREVLRHLTSSRPPRVLLHMPTGAGKTRTAMAVISAMLRDYPQADGVVVWLAHTEELCEQAAEEFERAWNILGDRPVSVFRHFGPYRSDLDSVRGGFLIGGLQLLYRDSLNQQNAFLSLGRRTAMVVMDEAHQALAPSYNHLLNLFAPDLQRMPILGLSATPGRGWLDAEEDLRLAEFFAWHKVTLQVEGFANPIDFLQQEGYLAQVEYIPIPYAPGNNFELTPDELEQLRSDLDLPDAVIQRLALDEQRNLLILTTVLREASQPDSRILVFACSVEHAKLIANLLRIKELKAECVTADTPADKRRQILEAFRRGEDVQIVTNYGVLTTGFDAPRTNVAVITRPTRSVVLYAQMVGRAARGPRSGGNERARVITVVDQIPGFRSIGEAFMFWDDIWTNQ